MASWGTFLLEPEKTEYISQSFSEAESSRKKSWLLLLFETLNLWITIWLLLNLRVCHTLSAWDAYHQEIMRFIGDAVAVVSSQQSGRKLLFTECIWQAGSSFPFTFPPLLRSGNSFCLPVSLISSLLTPNTQSEAPEGGSILTEDFHYRTLWKQLTALCSFLLTLISYLNSGTAEWKSSWWLRSNGDTTSVPVLGKSWWVLWHGGCWARRHLSSCPPEVPGVFRISHD